MKERCFNKSNNSYELYGGRGITISPEWSNSFETFLKDMGKKPDPKMSLDRIDNNGNYCKENCRWATQTQQVRNRSISISYKGETAIDASIRLKCEEKIIYARLKRGWNIDLAFNAPRYYKFNKRTKQ